MSIENIIYIVIGVLWFLFSVIGGAKKANAKRKQAETVVSQEKDETTPGPEQEIKKMLEDLMGGKKIAIPEKKATDRHVKITPELTKQAPAKLEVHKEHRAFIETKKKKKEKALVTKKENVSSYSDSLFSPTSHLQHPPDVVPAEPVSEIVQNLKSVGTQTNQLFEGFDAQKAFLFSEIFQRKTF